MESIYLLIPVSVLLVFGIAIAFWWSVRSGQFDDLEGPGFRVLMDDNPPSRREPWMLIKQESLTCVNALAANDENLPL
jgi:cbb3-type cytochrome oxidase maturation protein